MATEILDEPRTKGSLFDFRHRITVEEYHRMIEAGTFGPELQVELLEGVIVDKMTKKPPHVLATDLLDELLHQLLPRGSGYCISMGNPVTIEDRDGEPEPDADLRDTENVPLKENIHEYFEREVKPYVPDAWIDESKTRVAYEIPFNRHFYKYTPPRPLEEIKAEIKTIEQHMLSLIAEVTG